MAFPASLLTRTPAEGPALARQIAASLPAQWPVVTSMPEMLQPAAATQPTPELLAAAYFQTIAMANAGWGPR